MVEFGVGGSSAAAGESAVDVAGPDVVGEPGGWVEVVRPWSSRVPERGSVTRRRQMPSAAVSRAREAGMGPYADEFGGVVVGPIRVE